MNSLRTKKIFEQKAGELFTLFHGIEGSRRVPRGVWLEAKEKEVRDGTGNARYISGFHVFRPDVDPEKYLSKFQKPRELIVVEVEVRGTRPKPTNPEVLLARFMRVL